MDFDYKYGFEHLNEGRSYRSGADPVIVPHDGQYYMFVTISGGYWRSSDLLEWTFVEANKWPFEDMCAPAALSAKGKLWLFQSTFGQRPILQFSDPLQGKLEFFNRWMPRMPGAEGPWDPSLFYDEELDRWYMYFGSSNVFPLYGIELDYNNRLTYKGAAKGLIKLDPERHGWERFGQDHRQEEIEPFTEGAWMTKHGGKYYLQYGAPGTEYNVYATGTYVGDHPLGPFQYAPYNPVAYKPGGFACGVGHGNTFRDFAGHYWLTGTCWIGNNWGMERRCMMVPAGFDKDGHMWANTRFGDFPHRLKDQSFTGWMLLSRNKPLHRGEVSEGVSPSENIDRGEVSAGAVSEGVSPSENSAHSIQMAADDDLRTYWLAGPQKAGQYLQMDLLRECDIRAIQVNYADHQSGLFDSQGVYSEFSLQTSLDGKQWTPVVDLSKQPRRDRPNAYFELPKPVRGRYVRYVHGHIGAPQLAIADLRVFGIGPGAAPAAPQALKVEREKDRRNAQVSWQKVPGAVGYNLRWGVKPDKLVQTYQVWSERSLPLAIRSLNLPVGYSFAVEAFNEAGVSALSPIVTVP